MNAKSDLSSEFASLVNQLHQSPDDPALKQALMRRLPEMKALAQINPLALYRLAQIYPQTSARYERMMTQSATLGCTNAMLDLCQLFLKSKDSTGLKKAANYMLMIERSNDSYILEHSKSLMMKHPKLLAEMSVLSKQDNTHSPYRFFSGQPDRKMDEHGELRRGRRP